MNLLKWPREFLSSFWHISYKPVSGRLKTLFIVEKRHIASL